MKSTGIVIVTYLIFEFLIPACYRPYLHAYVCIVHTVY